MGWYTDEYGRRRPITQRKPNIHTYQKGVAHLSVPKRIQQQSIQREPNNSFRVGLSIVKHCLNIVLSQVPVVREIWLTYTVADTLCQKWNSIKEIFNRLKKDDLLGAAKVAGSEIVSKELLSIQPLEVSNISKIINKDIPEQYHKGVREIVENLFNVITDEEINFVKTSLSAS
jgi:hypothetical protein